MRVKFQLVTEIGNLSKEIMDYPLSISTDHTFVFTSIFPNITEDKFESGSDLDFFENNQYLKVSRITHMRDDKGYFILITLDFDNKKNE